MQPRHDVGSIEASAGKAKRVGRDIEHGDVLEAAGDELVDEPGVAAADVEHRRRRDDAEEIDQLERGVGSGLEPRDVQVADAFVAVVPVPGRVVRRDRRSHLDVAVGTPSPYHSSIPSAASRAS